MKCINLTLIVCQHSHQQGRKHVRKSLNTLRPWHNGRHFADDIYKWIFLNENVWIPNKISLKFVPQGPINNIPAMVQIMAWRRTGNNPLSGPMMVRLPTQKCVTRPQWVNNMEFDTDCTQQCRLMVILKSAISWLSTTIMILIWSAQHITWCHGACLSSFLLVWCLIQRNPIS